MEINMIILVIVVVMLLIMERLLNLSARRNSPIGC